MEKIKRREGKTMEVDYETIKGEIWKGRILV